MIRTVLFLLVLNSVQFATGQMLMPKLIVVDDEIIIDPEAPKWYYSIEEALRSPDSVKVLVLQGNQLNQIPKAIFKLKNLEELYLGYTQSIGHIQRNNIKEIPEEVFELTKLKVLQLNHNKISNIPENISKLVALETLELYANPLKKFPTALYELPNLKTLKIGGTEITSFPNDFHRLKGLNYLDLSFSKARKLPNSIGELDKLEWLDLSMSDFKMLPQTLGNCNQISHLDLFGTHDLDLEQTFDILKNIDSLKSLYINRIKYLPENIAELKNLEKLRVNNDKYRIDYVQLLTVVSKIESLTELSLVFETEGAWIIPDEIGLCTNLEKLSFYHHGSYHSHTVSTEIGKLKKLKEFTYRDKIDNFDEIKDLLPVDCYVH